MDYENIATSSELPSYSPSTPSPDYSYELSSGERLLENTPHRLQMSRPFALYIRKEGATTVILNDQEEGTTIPRYGRQGIISGSLCFEQSDNIVEVTVKVCLFHSFAVLDHIEQRVFRLKEVWTSSCRRVVLSQLRCSTSAILYGRRPRWNHNHPFARLRLYFHTSYRRPSLQRMTEYCLYLQPIIHRTFTWLVHLQDLPTCYRLLSSALVIPRSLFGQRLNSSLPLLTFTNGLIQFTAFVRISIPFHYVPRTRAHRPIIPFSSFLSSIKSAPEEWYQVVAQLTSRSGGTTKDPLHSLVSARMDTISLTC